MPHQITVLSLMRFSPEQLAKLQAVSPQLNIQQMTDASWADLPQALREQVEVLYGWGKHFQEAHRFPRLHWIQTHTAGVDYLFDKPVWSSQVLVTNLSGVHAVPMAEHALAMMLAFRWRLREMWRFQLRAEWPEGRWNLFALPELRGSTLGLVGYGAIARELARQAQSLGLRVLAANQSGQRSRHRGFRQPGTGDPEAVIPEKIYPAARLPDMLPECDYVVLLVPLTAATHHLLDATALARMKPEAFLFNLARGSVVDEAALIEALAQNRIAGAGLDVFETEPLPAGSPLWGMEQVIISPHVSGFTRNYDDRASDLFAENLRRYVNGEPLLNLVDRGKGY